MKETFFAEAALAHFLVVFIELLSFLSKPLTEALLPPPPTASVLRQSPVSINALMLEPLKWAPSSLVPERFLACLRQNQSGSHVDDPSLAVCLLLLIVPCLYFLSSCVDQVIWRLTRWTLRIGLSGGGSFREKKN